MKKRSNRLLSRRRKARPLLAEVGTAGGFVSTLLFALYNGGLGVWYASLWYGSICAYYILLSLLWCILLTAKRKAGPELGERRRKKVFLMTAVTLLVMNLALCIPVSLMVLNQRPIRAGMVPAITSAAYTTSVSYTHLRAHET